MYKKSTTVAMDYTKVALDDGTMLHLYGSPGQRRFAFMNTILIHKAQGLVILINNSLGEPLKELAYYLDQNQTFLQQQAAVVGVTHNDICPRPSIKEYQQFMSKLGHFWPVSKVDARKPADMLKLLMPLLDQTPLANSNLSKGSRTEPLLANV